MPPGADHTYGCHLATPEMRDQEFHGEIKELKCLGIFGLVLIFTRGMIIGMFQSIRRHRHSVEYPHLIQTNSLRFFYIQKLSVAVPP